MTWQHGPERYRYATMDDLPEMVAMLADPEVGRWLWFTPAPPEAFEAYFAPLLVAQATALAHGTHPDAHLFAAEDASGFLGHGAVVAVEGSPGGFEIGYQLARSAWGRGVGTRLAGFLAAWAVHVRAAWRLEANCLEGNAGSIAILEGVGLQCEGRRPGYRLRAGVRHTELLYGVQVQHLDRAALNRIAIATGMVAT